jgi:hypothetical protein
MLSFKKILDESLDSIWNPKPYHAGSMAPRKDFVSARNNETGVNQPAVYQNTLPEPEKPQTFPWPLHNINSDLADGYVYLLTSASKIAQCKKQNSSLTDKQKEELDKVFNKLLLMLKELKKIGTRIPNIVNMVSNTEPQIPFKPSQSPYIPTTANVGDQQSKNTQPQKL